MHLASPRRLPGRLSTPEALIQGARAGRVCVLLHEDELGLHGELVVPAEAASADVINFMARHGRGLISLALTRTRVEELRLPPMAAFNGTRRKTAFTVSIEARTGVTTGISTADRARTIAVASDPALGPDHIATPGHVFPLVAQDGGVLARDGFTEAAVDLARLAGRIPAGVICQILDDTGTPAGLAELEAFADHHDLLLGSITSLVAYRRRTEGRVRRLAESSIDHGPGGQWRTVAYAGAVDGEEHLALVHGDVSGAGPLRLHLHGAASILDLAAPDRIASLHGAMQEIAEAGRGVVVLIASPNPAGAMASGRRPVLLQPDQDLSDQLVGTQIMADLGAQATAITTRG